MSSQWRERPLPDQLRSRAVERFVLALALATLVAAMDAALGDRSILIGLLVAPPLLAATRVGPRWTAGVGVYSIALAVLLGVPNDFFGSNDHLVRVLTIAIASGLAIWIASLRKEREDDSVRLGVQYQIASTLTEADTLEGSASALLEGLARPLGWDMGGLWEVEEPRTLRRVASWYAAGLDPEPLEVASHALAAGPPKGLPGAVWERGEPVWVADVRTDRVMARGEAAQRAGLLSAVGFPLLTAGGMVGIIELFAREPRAPDLDQVELLAAAGRQIGEYVEGQHAAQALRESEARKGAILASALDPLISLDSEGRVIEFNAAAEHTFGYTAEEALGAELGELIVPPSLRERHRASFRRYIATEEPTILGRRLELVGMRKDGSEFPVELAINRIGTSRPPMFTGYMRDISGRREAEEQREELLRLEQLARVDASRARDQLEAILRGVADAVTAQGPDGGLLFANDAAVRMLGFDSTEELLSAPSEGLTHRFEILDEAGRPFPIDQLPGRRALRGETGDALMRFRMRDTGEDMWANVKATPIVDDAGEVVMAINVTEDVTEHKRAELQQQFLAESSRILGASLDADETLERIARLAVPEMADWCAVDLRGEGGVIERVALAHAEPAMVEKGRELSRRYPPDPRGERGVPQVLRSGRPELYREIPEELLRQGAVDEEHFRLLREFGMRSVMLVPMSARDEVLGVITFVSASRTFGDADFSLAQELARRCSTALDNARLFSERTHIAKTLQESLLPAELPEIPGLEAAARFHASGDGYEVGGDFYDLFETGGQGWTVVVGDVCGKGPDAAAITALARYTLRAAAMREHLPSRSLALLNEALLRQREDRRFCTVAYAYLETYEGGARVGLASGGHPLPLLLRHGGEVEQVGAHGTLLGVVAHPKFEDRTLELEPGDALVFYTDGVTEARSDGGPLMGESGLAELVAGAAGLPADAIAGRVEAAALEVQRGRPRDDIAVLVLRVPTDGRVPDVAAARTLGISG